MSSTYARRHARLDIEATARPARTDEYDRVIALVEERFPADDAASNVLATTLHRDKRFRPEHLRVVEIDGTIAGMMLFVERLVRIGTAIVRCAVVGPVATALAYEGRGVCSIVMRDALQWAIGEGYHFSMLWGHPWLYPHYGYAPGLKRYAMVLDAYLPVLGDAGYTVRPATTADTSALKDCYTAANAMTTLSELRSGEPWEWRPASDRYQTEVILDPIRAVRGYFRATFEQGYVDVHEIAALDDQAAQGLYDRLLELAREVEGREVRVNAPPDARWSRWAFAHGASSVVDAGGGHGMVRVLDMPGFFDAILPELRLRVRRSEFSHHDAHIRLETPLGSIGIAVEHGKPRLTSGRDAALVTLPWSAFGALVTGYRASDFLIGQPGVRAEGDLTPRLLQVLFPERNAHWSVPPYFWS